MARAKRLTDDKLVEQLAFVADYLRWGRRDTLCEDHWPRACTCHPPSRRYTLAIAAVEQAAKRIADEGY